MRIVFAGTPAFAAIALKALIDAQFQIVLVLTQPDRPAGRGLKLQESEVKKVASEYSIPVLQPVTLKSEVTQEQLKSFAADVIIVAAYGLILPESILQLPLQGCLNIHASLLPRWRGAAPIQRAIQAGDQETGITIMQMDQGLDTGDILLQRTIPIDPSDTAQSLHDNLAQLGAQCIIEALGLLQQGKLLAVEQNDEEVCYARKIEKDEAKIDWSLDAAVIDRNIRAFNPFPVAFTSYQSLSLKIWQARIEQKLSGQPGEIVNIDNDGITVACGKHAIVLEVIQRAGGKKLPVNDFLKGNPMKRGEFMV